MCSENSLPCGVRNTMRYAASKTVGPAQVFRDASKWMGIDAGFVCVDPSSGVLLFHQSRVFGFEYGKYEPWAQKVYPRLMRAVVYGKTLVEVHVSSIERLDNIPPALFEPLPGSEQVCAPSPGKWAARVPVPEYPAFAKQARKQGAVVVYALVQPDGTVRDATIAFSSSPEFADAVSVILPRLRAEPLRCAGTPVALETSFVITFSISE